MASVNRYDEVLQYESLLVLMRHCGGASPTRFFGAAKRMRLTELYAGSRAAVVTTSSEFRTGTLNTNDVRNMTDIQLTESERRDVRER